MTKNDLAAYARWRDGGAKVHFPHWQELPRLALYVDQVIETVNDYLRPLGVVPVTKAMVNNYVKKGVVMAPVKKKYSQNQLATLIVISLLKGAFAIPAIRAGIDQVTINAYPQAAYDRFIDLLHARLADADFPASGRAADPATEELLRLAVTTVVGRLQAAALLARMRDAAKPRELK